MKYGISVDLQNKKLRDTETTIEVRGKPHISNTPIIKTISKSSSYYELLAQYARFDPYILKSSKKLIEYNSSNHPVYSKV
ncbi:unnamed protein product, partial [Psylliodes chrysocephalus]